MNDRTQAERTCGSCGHPREEPPSRKNCIRCDRLVELNVAVHSERQLSEAEATEVHYGWTNLVKAGRTPKQIQTMFPMLYGPDGPLAPVAQDRSGPAESNSESEQYCMDCARAAFRAWRGWCSNGTEDWNRRRKEAWRLPDLPRLSGGRCPECGATEPLLPLQVHYVNHHGPWNTGLPDYFALGIADRGELESNRRLHDFGRPYVDTGIGRISWPEMLRQIAVFDEDRRASAVRARFMAENFVGEGTSWDPSFPLGREPARETPDPSLVASRLVELKSRWGEIVGVDLASATRPLEFTGRRRRNLVVWADADYSPPWGSWLELSRYLPERRKFTGFRAAINAAIAPLEVDHIEFTTSVQTESDGGHRPNGAESRSGDCRE